MQNPNQKLLDVTFGKTTIFSDAQFGERTFFSDAQFGERTAFYNSHFKFPATFMNVKYWSDSVRTYIARFLTAARLRDDTRDATWWDRFVKWGVRLSRDSPEGIPQKPTQFYIDSQNVDEVSNPAFKRYVADHQFIRAFKKEHHRFWYLLWGGLSDYGRDIWLWAFWSVLFAFLFALAYTPADTLFPIVGWTMPEWWQDFWLEHGAEFEQTAQAYGDKTFNLWSAFYFSIVTFTTLGFGDVVTANAFARSLVTIEVILGYVMLGGLISIFANKLARRS